MEQLVYKITTRAEWAEAEPAGIFLGAPVDHRDGFIHLSTASQARATAAEYFAGMADLLLVAVEAAALGADLRYEPGGSGKLYPHLYASLPLSAVSRVDALELGADGRHVFPDGFPG